MKMLHLRSKEMGDPLKDSSPLIGAASSGKLRLVRLLVEGGAQVNGSNHRGETALLAACKALRGEPAGMESVKLLKFLLQNKADANAQDRDGRTALMYACMQRAGALVASTLVAAGADPCMEDGSGASALVHAVNAQHQPTVQVLIDACRARGRDIIIIATEVGVNRGPVTRRYLNVPPSPDSSPVSCMSPSDIVLKTGSPSSPEAGNVFNFRGTTGKRGSSSRRSSCELSQLSLSGGPAPRQRVSSEPWLAIGSLDALNRAYEEGVRERKLKEEGGEPGLGGGGGGKRRPRCRRRAAFPE
ncbi:ankyrin repeat domain-containing protein 34B [Fundulus heteroclitus]|uniref:ankyrin repeat domain-containing protein 34B n=1 Tax=Fundulus heteroclitus TaxID=8078 RepID=UPI00165B7FA1|nr:ankyrin repeat domain-containing protein 34B [Fundulus heteroclitus]